MIKRPTYTPKPRTSYYTPLSIAQQMRSSFSNILKYQDGRWYEKAAGSYEGAVEKWVICDRLEAYIMAAMNTTAAYAMRESDRLEREEDLNRLDNPGSYQEIERIAAQLLSLESEDNE